MTRKDSLIKSDSSDINPYILDEDTRYKLNKTHYVLGENRYRDLQNRHHDRLARVQKLAEELGVEITPVKLPSPADVINHLELVNEYRKNKEVYDEAFRKVYEVCTEEQLLAFLEQQVSPK